MMKKSVSVLLAVMMVLGLLPMGVLHAFAEGDGGITADYTLSEGQRTMVTISEGGGMKYCAFTPAEDGVYIFESFSDGDTYAVLFDENGNTIDEQDEGGDGNNFLLESVLSTDATYYLGVRYYYSNDTGSFEVSANMKPHATSMSIDPDELTGYVNMTRNLSVSFQPDNAVEETVTWQSSNDTVASVDSSGMVSLNAAGTATVTATSQRGLTASCTVTVADYETILAGDTKQVLIDEEGKEVYFKFVPSESGSYSFYSLGNYDTYGYLYDDSLNLLESSDDGSDRNFRIEYDLIAGETYFLSAKLYDSEGTGDFSVKLTKNVAATAIEINQGNAVTGYVNTDINFGITAVPDGALVGTVSWSSSNTDAVSIDELYGYAHLEATGTAVITAESSSGLIATCTVTVIDYEQILAGTPKTVSITDGVSQAMYKFVPQSSGNYIFKSTGNWGPTGYLYDENMSMLYGCSGGGEGDNFKFSHYLYEGEVYLFETKLQDSGNGTYQVSVTAAPSATSVAFNEGESFTGYVNTTKTLSLTFFPEDASEVEGELSSSNPSVVSVSDMTLHLNSVGTADVTFTAANGLSCVCHVTVIDAELLTVGESKSVVISTAGDEKIFKVTPSEDMCVEFCSAGDADTYGTLCNASMDVLANDDDSGDNNNFLLQYELEGGKTYYFRAQLYGNKTGAFMLVSRQITYAESIAVTQGTAIETYMMQFPDLTVTATPSDSYVGTLTWTSSDNSVVTVDDYGDLSSVGLGTATVTVTNDRGLSASVTVTVKDFENITEGQTETASILYPGHCIVYRFTPDNDYHYAFYSEGNLYTYGKILDSDGDLLVDDYGSNGRNFRISAAMESGHTYYLVTGIYSGKTTGSFTVGVQQTVYTSELEILTLPDRQTYVTGFVGRYAEFEGLSARITRSDGEVINWTYGDSRNICGDYLEIIISGSTVSLSCGEGSDSFQLTLTENPVADLTVTQGTSATLTENYDGEMDNFADPPFFRYDYGALRRDIEVLITYKDGTQRTAHAGDVVDGYEIEVSDYQSAQPWTPGENPITVSYLGFSDETTITVEESNVTGIEIIDAPEITLIEYADGYINQRYDQDSGEYVDYFYYRLANLDEIKVRIHFKDGSSTDAYVYQTVNDCMIEADSNQYNNPYVLGSDNEVVVSYMGKTAVLYVTVVENPVVGITVTRNTSATLIENSDGYWTKNYDPDTDEYTSDFFNYTLPDMSDAEITIFYSDGTSRTANVGDYVDGYYVEAYSDQYENHWSLGENTVTVSYMGVEATMPVTVVETPAATITINSAPVREYVYNDCVYGEPDYFTPDDMTGLSFTVGFKNGTSKTYTYADIDENGMIDGHPYSAKAVNNVQTVGSNAVTFSYLGVEATYNVTVKDSSVSALEIVRLPDKPVVSRYYLPDWRGMQVKFTKKNGSTETVTISDANMVFGFCGYYGFYVGFEYDGTMAVICRTHYNDSTGFAVFYAGLSAEIGGLTYREDKVVTDVQIEDFSITGENMLVKATFADGTNENIRLTDIRDCRSGWTKDWIICRAMTDKGMLYVQISVKDKPQQKVVVFDLETCVAGSGSEMLLGDVTGDGAVTIDDVTRLQSYLTEYSVPNVSRIRSCGDVNGDGRIDVNDITDIQRYLAEVEAPAGIGAPIA